MDLEAIPGVGAKTAAALRDLDDPEGALEREDVAALAGAPGVSEGRAARIVRSAIRDRHDDPGGFLATDRAREIYDRALELLQDRAVTTYAEKRLETFYPSTAESRIEETRTFAERAMGLSVEDDALEALRDVEPLSQPRSVTVRDRCLATTDGETYAAAREAFPEMSVEIVDDARDLAELARGYSTVIALDEAFAGVDVEGDVRVEPRALDDPAATVPERTLAFFATNRTTIRAAIAVHRAADLDPAIDLDELDDALSRLDEDGSVVGDEELARLTAAVDDLDVAVSTAESVANDRLKDAIKARDVTIEGSDLLSLVERGAGVDSLLSRELADEYDAAVDDARSTLVDALGLAEDEAEIARRAFPEDPTYPVERDEGVVSRLRESLVAERDRRAAKRKREIAADLADRREATTRIVRRALELDVEYAISRFAADFDCTMPERGGRGFAIEAGRSPLLDEQFEAVEPVDYAVDGVAILSGVNSGGKTSTLDLVALVTALAHMGLPVPAESARVPAVEELAYHAKTQGTLDAGAFESTLRDFAAIADGTAAKLVLVDELESITEPGASARIIAGILEELESTDSTAVFVSHLAGEVRDACEFDVTVDGIRAIGLEDGELKVDRSPKKDHLARSTPELIVEKLAGEDDRQFYDRLLEKF
ncbi:DNA structure-specific ATPase involved in suppression of recombination, MutS family [Halanaeroarchaeum sp. HSR-CO]|uniref:MutS-related protein n=1 Tax=Halanaeroarchaeum sp. HSR-CO TaxID=2866382 RepID=UPI00217F17DD|nr:helix-hairpin-helix domain-containing protein [Halanaeroarchaeum sp. HSR-CO]UWG48984.1 DNA structure-specific ATPase involved in suppression of recombination, MutS family [Halanaeroarchaeum sp. HSR-CO]